MEIGLVVVVVILTVAVVALAYMLLRERKIPRTVVIQRPTSTPGLAVSRPAPPPAAKPPAPTVLPTAIAIGHERDPAMKISIVADGQDKKLAASRRIDDELAKNALASLPSVLPNLMLAEQIAGTHLMEVVIRGDLVRAANGVGWRAFAMGNDGIAQQARLMDPGLQTLANSVLAFQLVSVLVGQKHLLDVGRQLKGIDQKLGEIRELLRAERRGHIQASFRYAQDALHAAEKNELSSSTRQQLENAEYQLCVVFHTIQGDIEQVLRRPLEKSLVGSKNEYNSLKEILQDQRGLFEEMSACIEVRQACCYTASLFPGSRELLTRRLKGLRNDIDVFSSQRDKAKVAIELGVAKITSVWASDSAAERRDDIGTEVSRFNESVDQDAERHQELDRRISSAMFESDRQRTLYVTVQDRKVTEVREAMEQSQ